MTREIHFTSLWMHSVSDMSVLQVYGVAKLAVQHLHAAGGQRCA